jgi:hypothetical protein
MIRVTLKEVRGTQALVRRLEGIKNNLSLADLGEVVRKRMISEIEKGRKREKKTRDERYKGKYATHISDVIEVDISKQGQVGVGDIDVLNQKVPYWYLINAGGKVPGPTHGYFNGGNPQGGAGGDASFTYVKDGPLMKPARPIKGMKYIEKTIAWTQANLQKYINIAVEAAMSKGSRK